MLVLLFAVQGFSQSAECEIQVETKITTPARGRNNGKVRFEFSDKAKTYKIFLVNRNPSDARVPLRNNEAAELKEGFYDFVIVDGNGCSKQLTVTIKENQN
ncbi:MAG: hypothetical protein KF845_08355 [Cyclobacteriaceae bacterium]|nr:hypothetical protein [Cyclobacteriaceae bacterium]